MAGAAQGQDAEGADGRGCAYAGDHIELSDGGDDFASTVGIGAIVSTKFTWPDRSEAQGQLPARRAQGRRVGEVDPHLQREDAAEGPLPRRALRHRLRSTRRRTRSRRTGACTTPSMRRSWKGPVELRGLGKARYRITDYVNGADLGIVTGPIARLPVQFEHSLADRGGAC